MNITFLIGNGFDVALGLKTRYSDFLKEYISTDSVSETIQNFKEKIKDDKEIKRHNWSDLELEFGKYTENLSTEDEISEIYVDCINSIGEYIKKEEYKIDFEQCLNIISEEFTDNIKNFYIGLPHDTKNYFTNTSQINTIQQNIIIDFVSYNYTECIEKCIKHTKAKNSRIDNHTPTNRTYSTIIGGVYYAHGMFANRDPIFGVNDESQIKFKNTLSKSIKRKIIKPQKNDAIANGTKNTLSKVIEGTKVFCIFGMSIGDTDNYWWKMIGDVLKKSGSVQVIYYVLNKAINFNSMTFIDEKLDIEEKYRDFLMNKFNFSEEEKNKLEKNIHVILNSDIFQFDLIKLTEEYRSKKQQSKLNAEEAITE